MAIEAKEILSFLGVEGDDINTIKAAFNERYVPAEKHKADVGAVNGRLQTSLLKMAKEVGIEVDKSEFKDLDTVDIPLKLAEKVKGKISELEAGKTATATEIEAKFKGEIDTWKSKAESLKALAETTGAEFEKFKGEVAQKERNGIIGGKFNETFTKLPFSTTVSDLTKTGFKALLSENYKFDLDEKGNELVIGKDGQPIKSTAKAGTFATYSEIIESEFKKQPGLAGVADPKKVTTFAPSWQQASAPTGGKPVREVAPRH